MDIQKWLGKAQEATLLHIGSKECWEQYKESFPGTKAVIGYPIQMVSCKNVRTSNII